MDVYVIPPLSNLELMDEGDRFFCLAQLYKKDENYRKFFQQKVADGKWVTLDNGAGDHNTVSKEELLDIARELQPSEMIPLDILFDGESTLANLEWTIKQMIGDTMLQNIEIFACPQGKDLEEWIHCYKEMLKNPMVNTIGMSKLAIPYVMSGVKGGDVNIGRDRNRMYMMLQGMGLIQKPLHFLGAGEPDEFGLYQGDELCRSTDSCFTIWGGMMGQDFSSRHYERIPTPKNYFEREVHPDAFPLILKNIDFLRIFTK